ncbi:MAG: E2/UBC family protein [Pyrinomonadaceae bacterium]
MRRQFLLLEADREHLDARGLAWETIIDSAGRWLLVHEFPVPDGYNLRSVTAAVQIGACYPDAQLDMVYFHPPLVRTDGRAIGALSNQLIDGKTFQRWSRHRTGQNPWRPGEDDIAAHLSLVEHWLEREFKKG